MTGLQNGVKAMIVIAFVVVALVVVYAILYQVVAIIRICFFDIIWEKRLSLHELLEKKSQVYKKTCSSRHIRKEEKNFSSQEKCWSADKPDCIWKCLNWSISIELSLNQDLFWIETHMKLNWHCRLQTVSRYLWSSTNLVIPFKYFIFIFYLCPYQ